VAAAGIVHISAGNVAIAADPGYHVIKTYKQGGDLKKARKIDNRDRVN
jgi:hypothetical protein